MVLIKAIFYIIFKPEPHYMKYCKRKSISYNIRGFCTYGSSLIVFVFFMSICLYQYVGILDC